MGSGMVIDFLENQTIVITAGHVCSSDIDTGKVKKFMKKYTSQTFR